MFLCVSLARKAENPVFPTQAGLEMLKHNFASGTFALCKDMVVSFWGKWGNGSAKRQGFSDIQLQ